MGVQPNAANSYTQTIFKAHLKDYTFSEIFFVFGKYSK